MAVVEGAQGIMLAMVQVTFPPLLKLCSSKSSFEYGADKVNTFWEEQSSMSVH